MNKTKTNISVKTNTGSRRKADIIAGDNGPYISGDILDANAVKEVVDNAVTANSEQGSGSTNDVVVISLDGAFDTSSGQVPLMLNSDIASQICDYMDQGKVVFGSIEPQTNMPMPQTVIFNVLVGYNYSSGLLVSTVWLGGFVINNVYGGPMLAYDVTSRYPNAIQMANP